MGENGRFGNQPCMAQSGFKKPITLFIKLLNIKIFQQKGF
jgi:hypothetical protein